jgi:hypothetical protein
LLLYGLWHSRNKQVFEQREINKSKIIPIAAKCIQDYHQSNNDLTLTSPTSNNQRIGDNNQNGRAYNKTNHTRQAKQRKPRIMKIKGNCDANLVQNGR